MEGLIKGTSGRFDFYQTVTITAIIKIKKRGGVDIFFGINSRINISSALAQYYMILHFS